MLTRREREALGDWLAENLVQDWLDAGVPNQDAWLAHKVDVGEGMCPDLWPADDAPHNVTKPKRSTKELDP